MNDLLSCAIVFLAAFSVASALAHPILKLLIRLKSKQTVSQYVPEHAAKQGTPTMGGLIIGVGFLSAALVLSAILPVDPSYDRYFFSFAFLYILFGIIGFVDDYVIPRKMVGKRGLGWTQKLVMQIVGCIAFAFIGGFPATPEAIAISAFLILFFSNAYNFSDGMDALAGSLLLVISLGLGWVAVLGGRIDMVAVLCALTGGCLPFLWLNRPPARVFMGDVGALPIGAVLGAIVACLVLPNWHPAEHLSQGEASRFGVASWPVWLGLAVVSFVMMVELIPVPLQILSVKLRKKRLFPMTPIHHAYQKAGWKETRVVAMFVGVQVACSIVGPLLTQGALASIENGKKENAISHLQGIRLYRPE